jgi:hypothetical protein
MPGKAWSGCADPGTLAAVRAIYYVKKQVLTHSGAKNPGTSPE